MTMKTHTNGAERFDRCDRCLFASGEHCLKHAPRAIAISTPEGLPFDVDDGALAFVRMRSDASMQVEISWAAHQKEDDSHNVEIFGTEAGARAYPGEVYRFDRDLGTHVEAGNLGLPLKYPPREPVRQLLPGHPRPRVARSGSEPGQENGIERETHFPAALHPAPGIGEGLPRGHPYRRRDRLRGGGARPSSSA